MTRSLCRTGRRAGRNTLFWTIVFSFFLTCLPDAAKGQCAMCRAALADSVEGRALSVGFNRGILFLVSAPFFTVGLVAFLIVRERRP